MLKLIRYETKNKTRLGKNEYKSPFYNTKATRKQKKYLKDLLIKTGFCTKRGIMKDFADTLPYAPKDIKTVEHWLDKLTTIEASDLISVLK